MSSIDSRVGEKRKEEKSGRLYYRTRSNNSPRGDTYNYGPAVVKLQGNAIQDQAVIASSSSRNRYALMRHVRYCSTPRKIFVKALTGRVESRFDTDLRISSTVCASPVDLW